MFVVTQTHVQFVVPNVIKHKILTEFYYNFACFNPPLCVSLACFSPCDDWTAFSIFFGHFSTKLALLACQKLLSNVWLFRLWDIITLFCLSAVGLNCNSTLIENSRTSRFLAEFFNTDFVIETSRRSYHHHRYIQTLKLKVLAPERNPNLVKI